MSPRVATLVSVNVGMPREVSWQGRTVFTGIWKEAVQGARQVRRLNVDGDGQGDLAGHGGEQRAVYVYQLDSYRYWGEQLHRDDFVFGQFGENFTVDGLGDDEVCVGDRYRIGSALFEVTQPRVTCYRVGIRMDEPRMPALLTGHGRPGFYLRVLEEGAVRAGDDVVQEATGAERMTVATLNALLYVERRPDPELLERALQIPALSPGWQASLRALLEQERGGAKGPGNAGLTSIGPPPAWPGFRALRVVSKHSESATVLSLELEADDGAPLPRALPGQFVTLRLEPGGGAPPVVRSYSLSGPPGAARYRITVKVEPDGTAGRLLRAAVEVGERIEVAAPRGQFTLDEGARPIVLVSAGVGVTPVLAMLHALHDSRSTRDIWWLHGARNGTEHTFAHEARSLLATLSGAHSRVWYSQPGPDDRAGTDYDEVGRITSVGIAAAGAPIDGEFFLCGPAPFMAAIGAGLDTLGVAPACVHTEAFGAQAPINPGIVPHRARPPHPPEGGAGTGPLISFVRTGLNVRWDDAYSTILELAEACDVPVRWSCRSGVCHTCETALLDGAVTYDPEPLEPPAAGNVLLCCSRPGRDLAVDL
ncbi:MAG TPA: MOSC and FAD-binding oxidoreductase domain-containing protein [Acidimicrobiia bacterium]|jgi:ferredoxin-NADP reductase/MOSC domain-containing protein YiiM/ferredoxin|nr:MOSC and FAD-binding oxidoreductase domain-containing protein [Acidimicrobiia bacterium]